MTEERSVQIIYQLKKLLDSNNLEQAEKELSSIDPDVIEKNWLDVGNAYMRIYQNNRSEETLQKALGTYLSGLKSDNNYESPLVVEDETFLEKILEQLTSSWDKIHDGSLLSSTYAEPFRVKELTKTFGTIDGDGRNFLKNHLSELPSVVIDLLRREFGAHDPVRFFLAFEKFEDMLKALNPLYRDHIIHCVRVYLLNVYLLTSIRRISPGYFESIFSTFVQPNADVNYHQLATALFLSSIFHDFAYPVEKIDELNERVNKFFRELDVFRFEPAKILPEQAWIHAAQDFIELISRKNDKAAFGLSQAILDGLSKRDHGVIGALILMNGLYHDIVPKLLKPDDYYENDFKKYISTAAQAIALHNLNFEISLEELPLAFFLVLCDELQEWGRTNESSDHIRLILRNGTDGLVLLSLIDYRKGQGSLGPLWNMQKAYQDKVKRLTKLRSTGLVGIVYLIENRQESGKNRTSVYKVFLGRSVERIRGRPIITLS